MQESAPDGKTLPELQAEHTTPPRKRTDRPAGELAEERTLRNYLRDLVLGFNDGVVSVYAVCAGLAGAGFAAGSIAVAGVAASVGGALSMGLGEYVSTKSQEQYYAAERRREAAHVRAYPDLERAELREMLVERNYPPHVVDALERHLIENEEAFVDFMMREEFGVGEEATRSPLAASGLIMLAFLAGAACAVLPYFLLADELGLAGSSALSLAGLFIAGAAKGRLSGLGYFRSGAEMALLGAVAAAITYVIGLMFNVQV